MFEIVLLAFLVSAGIVMALSPTVDALARNELRPMTETVAVDLPFARADVWQAYWRHTRFRGAVQHIDDAKCGDLLDYDQIVGEGRQSQIMRLEARLVAIEHGRHFKQVLLRQDGAPFVGGDGSWEAVTLEDIEGGTRVTNTLHATRHVPLQRYLMRKALETDLRKLCARLVDTRPTPMMTA